MTSQKLRRPPCHWRFGISLIFIFTHKILWWGGCFLGDLLFYLQSLAFGTVNIVKV